MNQPPQTLRETNQPLALNTTALNIGSLVILHVSPIRDFEPIRQGGKIISTYGRESISSLDHPYYCSSASEKTMPNSDMLWSGWKNRPSHKFLTNTCSKPVLYTEIWQHRDLRVPQVCFCLFASGEGGEWLQSDCSW